MPIGDLSLVSTAIVDAIRSAPQFVGPVPAIPVTVTMAGPQEVKTEFPTTHNVISVYLFHISEDADSRAYPRPSGGTGPVPIQQSPLGLILYYVVNTHDAFGDSIDSRIRMEQLILGIVAKTIHDHPTLRVNDPGVSPPGGDPFDVIVRPVSIDEAVQFWSSDDTHLVRPSLYLETRVVFLEPQKPQSIPGTVLFVNSPIFLGFGPQLVTSRSTMAFFAPSLGVRSLEAEPARAALFAPTGLPSRAPEETDNQVLVLEGNGFGKGPYYLDLSTRGNTVRLDLNHAPPTGMPAWVIAVTSDQVRLRVWTEIFDHSRSAAAAILPGTYTARFIGDEPPRPRSSNEVAFQIVPQILSVARTGSYLFTLTISGDYLLEPEPAIEIQLMVGSELFERGSVSPPAARQLYVAAGNEIVFHRTAVLNELVDESHPLAVNLIVNGVNATPAWITESGV